MSFYKAQQWTRAARCFAALGARIGKGRALSSQRKLRVARLLQNAARLYARAARRKRLRTQVRYLQLGLGYLRKIQKSKLCQGDITQECTTQTRRLKRSLYRRWRTLYRRLRRRRKPPQVRRPVPPNPVRRVGPVLVVRRDPPPRRVVTRSTPQARVALVRGASLAIKSAPESAKVFVNGTLRGQTPLRIRLAPGVNVASVRIVAPCYQVWKRRISLSSEQGIELSPQLRKRALPASDNRGKLRMGWTFFVLGAVVVAGSIGIHVASQLQQDNANQLYNQALAETDITRINALYASFQSAANSGNLLRTIGIVVSAVGGVAMIVGIVRLTTIPPDAKCEVSSTAIGPAPTSPSSGAMLLWQSQP